MPQCNDDTMYVWWDVDYFGSFLSGHYSQIQLLLEMYSMAWVKIEVLEAVIISEVMSKLVWHNACPSSKTK